MRPASRLLSGRAEQAICLTLREARSGFLWFTALLVAVWLPLPGQPLAASARKKRIERTRTGSSVCFSRQLAKRSRPQRA